MGEGVGDLNIKAECNLLIQTCSIRDVRYYCDWTKLTSTWTKDTSVSGRTIYVSPYNWNEAIDMEYKFKSLPSSTFIGLRSLNSGIKFSLGRINNQWRVDWNGTSHQDINPNVQSDSVVLIKSTAMNTQELYIDNTLITSKTTNNNSNELRCDVFNNSPFELEYIIIP